MANLRTSQRGTSWDRWFTDNPFRKGFADARAREPFDAAYETRGIRWQNQYELGRQFALSSRSRRWARMPAKRNGVTKTLIVAWRRAAAEKDVVI